MIEIYGDCPRCNVIASLLDEKNINFIKINDMSKIIEKAKEIGVKKMPICFVEGEYKTEVELINIINKL